MTHLTGQVSLLRSVGTGDLSVPKGRIWLSSDQPPVQPPDHHPWSADLPATTCGVCHGSAVVCPIIEFCFSSRLNEVRLERSEMTCCGRLFHTVGVAWENERSVKTRLVRSFCFCCRNVNDVMEHATWWRQSDSSVLTLSKSCKQWLRPCTIFSTWLATSVDRQGSELRGQNVWTGNVLIPYFMLFSRTLDPTVVKQNAETKQK